MSVGVAQEGRTGVGTPLPNSSSSVTLDGADVACARAARRALRIEGHGLTFTELSKAAVGNGAAVEEYVFAALRPDETKPAIGVDLVD